MITRRALTTELDRRDAATIETFKAAVTDPFKVEVTQRLEAGERLLAQMQDLMVGMIGSIQLSNLAQPEAEPLEIHYYVMDGHGFRQSTTREGFERARVNGEKVYREIIAWEDHTIDPARFAAAQEIIAKVHEEIDR
jgi:hypothetical protein